MISICEGISIIRRGVKQKRAMIAGRAVLNIAKKRHDPMMARLKAMTALRNRMKAALRMKYKQQARMQAMRFR